MNLDKCHIEYKICNAPRQKIVLLHRLINTMLSVHTLIQRCLRYIIHTYIINVDKKCCHEVYLLTCFILNPPIVKLLYFKMNPWHGKISSYFLKCFLLVN